MYVIFENRGWLDDRALSVMGLNAKENADAIGYFGTGLKYAIAISLRQNWKMWVQPGDGEVYQIGHSVSKFRDKLFSIPTYKGRELPFTLEYGKNWLPWMAYRELRSNAMDEGGKTYADLNFPEAQPDVVRIIIQSQELLDIHLKPDSIFFEDRQAIKLREGMYMSTKHPGSIFYRGIFVGKHNLPGKYSYNIYETLTLNEDRTVDAYNMNTALYYIAEAIEAGLKDRDMLAHFICPEENTMEGNISAHLHFPDRPGHPLYDAVLDAYRNRPGLLFEKHRKRMRGYLQEDAFNTLPLRANDAAIIKQVTKTMAEFDMPIDGLPVVWNADLGETLFGLVADGRIYISRRSFDEGYRNVLATMIEEYIHFVPKYGDFTRGFQDFTLRLAVRLMEEVQALKEEGN